jgi:hypothetical protein
MSVRDAVTHMFVAGTEKARDDARAKLADLTAQLEQCDADEALVRTDHQIGKLTVDEAAGKVALVKARREYLVDLIAEAERTLAEAEAAHHAHLHAKDIAERKKQAKASHATLAQHCAALKKAAAAIEPAIEALAAALKDLDGPADRAQLVYDHAAFANFNWLAQEAARAAGLTDLFRLPPADPTAPAWRGVDKELAQDCQEALDAFSLALGLTEPPAPPPAPPAPPPVYIDPDAAKRRADAELARMFKNAGRARPDLGEQPPEYDAPRAPPPGLPDDRPAYQPGHSPVETATRRDRDALAATASRQPKPEAGVSSQGFVRLSHDRASDLAAELAKNIAAEGNS